MKRSTPIKYTANTSRYNIRSKSDKPSGRTDTGVFFFYIYLRSTSFSHVCSPRPSSCDWIMLTDSPTGIVNVQPILEAIWLFLLGSCRRLANAAPSSSISSDNIRHLRDHLITWARGNDFFLLFPGIWCRLFLAFLHRALMRDLYYVPDAEHQLRPLHRPLCRMSSDSTRSGFAGVHKSRIVAQYRSPSNP